MHPVSSSPPRGRKYPALIITGGLLLGASLVSLGFLLGRKGWEPFPSPARAAFSETGINLKPGPWGALIYVPMTISAPPELLPVRATEDHGAHWFQGKLERENLAKMLDAWDVPATQRDTLLSPEKFHALAAGVEILPTYADIAALPEASRLKIYRYLSRFRENADQLEHLPLSTLSDRFRECGVSAQTLALLKAIGCINGKYLIVSGVPGLLSQIPDYDEKVRFFKATTWEQTLLLKLHVTTASNIPDLVSYWGKATWNTDVRSILESLSRVPGGI